MPVPHNKPLVFISSTVRDFADLRSAIRYWLKEMGCEVRMSEFTDFYRMANQDTFASCLSAIEGCDYYILLVGGRKGSEYEKGVSITQQEYRTAARFAREGRIKPVVLIRSEVLTALSERSTLEKAGAVPNALSTPSSALEDPDFVRDFVQEIKDTEFEREGEGPAGALWYYRFSGFDEVIDALRMNLNLDRSIRKNALLANVRAELLQHLESLLEKHDDTVQPRHAAIAVVRSQVSVTGENITQYIELSREQALMTFLFWVQLPDGPRLQTSALREALSSGEFLAYRQDIGTFEPSPVYRVMEKLLSAIASLESLCKFMRVDRFQDLSALGVSLREREPSRIPGVDLMTLYGVHDSMIDILRLDFALLDFIRNPTSEVVMPQLSPVSPVPEFEEGVKAQRLTQDDISFVINNAYKRHQLTEVGAFSEADFFESARKYRGERTTVYRMLAKLTINVPALRAVADAQIAGIGNAEEVALWHQAKDEVSRWENDKP